MDDVTQYKKATNWGLLSVRNPLYQLLPVDYAYKYTMYNPCE